MSTRMRTVPKTHREAGRGAVNRSNRELSDTRLSRVKMVIICSGGAWLVRVSRFAQTGADFRQRLLDKGALKSERINVKS